MMAVWQVGSRLFLVAAVHRLFVLSSHGKFFNMSCFPSLTSLFYQACHMSKVVDWCYHAGRKQWVDIEQAIYLVNLPGLPWCSSQVPPALMTHPTIGATWAVCRKVFPLAGISPYPLPMYPIMGNPSFPASQGGTVLLELMTSKFRAPPLLVAGAVGYFHPTGQDATPLGIGILAPIRLPALPPGRPFFPAGPQAF